MSHPGEPASWPVQPAPRRRRWPLAVGLLSAVLVTGVGGAAVVVATRGNDHVAGGPVGSPTPTAVRSTTASPTPTPAASPSTPSPLAAPSGPGTPVPIPPSPSSTPPPQPIGPNRTLAKNSIYDIDLGKASVSCELDVRRPKPPLADKKLAPYLRDVVGCLVRAFTKPLGSKGFTAAAPRITTYHSTVTTPCGKFDQRGSPAYYCSATQTIYWPDTVDDGDQAYTFARLGYVGLVAHEFGHHLQASTGMLDDYALAYAEASKKSRLALSRRLELQAQCFEGVFLDVARKPLSLVPYDRTELRAWHSYTGDEDPPKSRKPDHGTSAEQYRWLERGLDSADFARCNTWTADKKDVA